MFEAKEAKEECFNLRSVKLTLMLLDVFVTIAIVIYASVILVNRNILVVLVKAVLVGLSFVINVFLSI